MCALQQVQILLELKPKARHGGSRLTKTILRWVNVYHRSNLFADVYLTLSGMESIEDYARAFMHLVRMDTSSRERNIAGRVATRRPKRTTTPSIPKTTPSMWASAQSRRRCVCAQIPGGHTCFFVNIYSTTSCILYLQLVPIAILVKKN